MESRAGTALRDGLNGYCDSGQAEHLQPATWKFSLLMWLPGRSGPNLGLEIFLNTSFVLFLSGD